MGVDKTVLTAADGGPSGQAALFIGAAKDVTVKDMTIEPTGGTGDASPIKATFSGDAGNHDVSENLTLENLTLVGNNLGNGLNLHGVRNVVVNNVTVENYAKCGISLAYATDVEISNVTFTKTEGCWADIGLMYKDSADYAVPVTGVVLGDGIDFAMYAVYAENAEYTLDYSEYADVFGLTQTADGWALTRTIAARIENADGSYVNYSTVQGAINAAKANDVVAVTDTTFTAPIEITVPMTIKGLNGAATLTFTQSAGIYFKADVTKFALENIVLLGVGATGNEAMNEPFMGIGTYNEGYGVHMTLTDTTIDGFDYGIYLSAKADAPKEASIVADNLTVKNCLIKGVYVETLTDSSFTDCTFTDNGSDAAVVSENFKQWVSGVDINLKYGDYENITFTGCTFTGNGANNGAALLVKARDDGSYASNPATLTGVTVTDCTFTDNNLNIVLGEKDKDNSGPDNVTIDDETLISHDYRAQNA